MPRRRLISIPPCGTGFSLCCLALAALLTLPAPAALVDTTANRALWDELGLQSAETIDLDGLPIDAYRFKDATGALAGSFLIPRAHPIGNYAFACQGRKCPSDLAPLAARLPQARQGTLPVLKTYPPPKGMAPASERYILGPAGLNEALPQIPASAAAFQFGTEAITARYRTGQLAIFNFPTPQMARQQLREFEGIPGALARRSGPLIGVVLNSPDPKSAETLLKEAEYQGSISWDEQPPLIIRPQTAAQIVLGGMELAGIILIFCVVSGLSFGLFKYLQRRFGDPNAGDGVIALNLIGK